MTESIDPDLDRIIRERAEEYSHRVDEQVLAYIYAHRGNASDPSWTAWARPGEDFIVFYEESNPHAVMAAEERDGAFTITDL